LKKQVTFLVALAVFFLGAAGLVFARLYFQKPFSAVGWLESCLFYLCLFLLIVGVTYIVLRVSKIQDLMRRNLLFSVGVFFTSILIAEFALRAFHINRAYIETRGGKYFSPYIQKDRNIHRTYYPGSTSYLITDEYNYMRHHNNYGYSDSDFFRKVDTAEILIQTYGDSFTEGDGSPVDSCYPAVLRRLFNSDTKRKFAIQNFGICGNDPGFYWKQMNDLGAGLQPDIAVITYCTNDITTDFFTRGGLERFKNGYYSGFEPPKWEWLYAYSYLFRLFANSLFGVSYNNFFLTEQQKHERLKSLEQKWNETFTAIAAIARKNNIRVLLIKKPERSELDKNSYDYNFTFFEKMVDTIAVFKRYDLLPFYRDSMHITANNSANYYWPKDGHHNSTGYAVMAQGVYAGLKQAYPEIFSNLDSAKTKE
jgi:lysophospholipase L1-like esterase